MTYIKILSDKKTTRRIVFLLVFLAFFAVPALIVAADDDEEEELYVSSYSNKKSRRSGYGITQYQANDEAADYQNMLFSTKSSKEDDDYDEEYVQDEESDDDLDYARRRRYSSKNSRPLSSKELEEKYDFASKSNAEGLLVGSDEFLDAATADVYALRLEEDGSVTTSSGLGSKRKRTKSKGLFGFAVETNARDGDSFKERWIDPDSTKEAWTSQILPQGLMYPSYLAGRKESRLESVINYTEGYGALWDITLGGRAPIWRYGTTDVVHPEGWELELEGAALLRLDWERHRNLAATDYRAGVPIVYGTRRWQFKTGYYHVSSHLGDNYLTDNFRPRVHYSRDSVMFGLAVKPVDDVRLYAEVDYAFHTGKTADPVELQFGLEYSPQFNPNMSNWAARPFFATHAHLYQERDFGGYWTTQTGIQWRSATNALMRVGAEYFQGGDDLYQFHTRFQRKYGAGFWFDF
jgi:hypothetical protein